MPKYDQICTLCHRLREIEAAPGEHPPCPVCGGGTERCYVGGYSFWGDEFPGGKWVDNLGDKPVYVESKSQLKHEMQMRGLAESVRHVGVPGSDKSPYTTRHI